MMSPELRWILSPGSTPVEIDRERAARLAIAHGVAAPALPYLGPRLRGSVARSATDDLRHRANLAAILRAFAAAGVPVAPLKGPVLADKLYPAGGARVYHDLDLLVQPADVNSSIELLRTFGYRPLVDVSNPPANPVLRHGGEMTLRSRAMRSPVDLHWTLLGWSSPRHSRLTNIWHRLEPGAWQGQPIRQLSDTDLVAYLCYHGSKHLWLQLKLLHDVARMFETKLAADWGKLLAEAEEQNQARFLLLGPWLAHCLLGSSLPAPWQDRCERDPALLEVAAYVIEALETPEEWQRKMASRPVWSKLLGTRRAAFRYRCFEALAPSPAEWNAVQLPEQLSFLYYPYRPLRLAGARLSRIWTGVRRVSAA